MKKLISTIMVLLILTGIANAQIVTTGNVNVRTGPGLEYDIIGSIPEGEAMYFYSYCTEADERGVDWYLAACNELNGWVSSKYAQHYVFDGAVSAEEAEKYIDVSEYFDETIDAAAEKTGLKNYYRKNSDDAPIVYFDKSLVIGRVDSKFMSITGPGYSIYGAAVGMNIDEACEKLAEAGMTVFKEVDGSKSFHSPGFVGDAADWVEYDFMISLEYENDTVRKIEWND